MSMKSVNSSGVLAASAAANITALGSHLVGFILTPAAADAVLTIYDNAGAAASGTVLAAITVKASTASLAVPLNWGVAAQNGIAYSLVGAGATAIVYWTAGN